MCLLVCLYLIALCLYAAIIILFSNHHLFILLFTPFPYSFRIQKEKEEKERLEQQRREEELRQQEEEKLKHKKGRAPKPHQDLVKPSPGHSRPDSAASINLQQGSLGVINPTAITSNASINSNVGSVVGRWGIIVIHVL